MPRFVLILSLMIILISCGLGVLIRSIGTFRLPPEELKGIEVGCENTLSPCIYGIVPGVTPVYEARNKLLQMGFERNLDDFTFRTPTGCLIALLHKGAGWEAVQSIVQRVLFYELYECSSLQLGDIVPNFGHIEYFTYPNPFGLGGLASQSQTLILEDGIVVGVFLKWRQPNSFSPHSKITYVMVTTTPYLNGFPWFGFAIRSYFCHQLVTVCP